MERILKVIHRHKRVSIYSFLPKKIVLLVVLLGPFYLTTGTFCEIDVPAGWQEEKVFVETAPNVAPRSADRLCGFIPYTRNYLDPVYTNSRPLNKEITDVFKITLAKGEYEPFIVALYALEDLNNLKIEVQDVKFGKYAISSKQFEVRKIASRAVLPKGRKKGGKRYKLIPSLLKLTSLADLKAGRTSAFWITVQALKSSVSGTYLGRIVLSRNGETLRKLKLEVVILPFALEEIPDKVFAALYTPSSAYPNMEKNARLFLKDMRAHGMTSYSPIASAWGKPLAFDKKGDPKVANLVKHLQWAKEEGFWGPTLLNVQKLIRAGRPNLDANYTKFKESIDVPNLKKLVLFLEKERRKNNWPEIIYIPIDEPGTFTDRAGTKREEMAVLLLTTLSGLNVRSATTIDSLVDNKHRRLPRWKNVVGWWEKMRPYCTVRIYHNGYPQGETSLPKEIADAESRGHEVMLYENTSTMGIDPKVSRMYFGFYGWRSGVSGITSWTYPLFANATGQHAWADWKEQKRDLQSYFKDPNYKLPPTTICWEMVREGIDDAKYLYLYEKALRQSSKGAPKTFKILNRLKADIDQTKMSQKEPHCDWDGNQFTHYRQIITQSILSFNTANQ